MNSYGRRKIFTDATEITIENVVDEVRKATMIHEANRAEINKLYDYYRGKTDILKKEKLVRPEINHKINENRAYEAVNFHKGYAFGEPIQYVRRENSCSEISDELIASDINSLNGFMSVAGKAACDRRLAEWLYISGSSYRLTLPNKKWTRGSGEPPFEIHSLEPGQTFVVYSSAIGHKPMFSVHMVEREDKQRVFGVYTENSYFEFTEFGTPAEKKNTLGMNPIVEYPSGTPRLGVFEIAIPLMDALDELQSNRLDDIVQHVNSILAVMGAELDKDGYDKLAEWKMMFLPDGTDAKYISAAMSQNDLQTLKSDICQAIWEICGVPNRNGGSSTSDTGQAVELRDGWSAAETRAKDVETVFKESEMQFLRIVLRIMRDTVGTNLNLMDIEPYFTRRNYENIASKSQVLIAMLNSPWIHPEVAYATCGMFPDPQSAYLQGMAWHDSQQLKQPVQPETEE